MKRIIPVAVFAVLTLAALPAAVSAETEHVTRRVKLDPGGTLRLNSFAGRVTITGTDQSEVTIDAVRHGSRDKLDRLKLEITSDASSVRIEENRRERSWFNWGRNNVVETDFDIKVPRRVSLDITLFSASLDVIAVDGGSHRISTFSSRTRLDDVNGPIRIKSFSGGIEVRQTQWRDQPAVEIETFSGQVRLRLPDSARGTISFDSFSGDLSGNVPVTLLTSRRGRINGQFGPARQGLAAEADGRVRVSSFSGGLVLER
jgi:hypothetical protein